MVSNPICYRGVLHSVFQYGRRRRCRWALYSRYLIELGFMSRERVDLRQVIRWYGLIVPFIGPETGMHWGFQNRY